MVRAILTALAAACLHACAAAQGVVINEVQTGNPDWVEITNLSDQAVDVGGWTLHSSHGFTVYPPVALPTGVILAAGESLLVLEGYASFPLATPPSPSALVVQPAFTWGWVAASTGSVLLADAQGQGRDLVIFGEAGLAVPGAGMGQVFAGRVPRGAGEPLDAIFRTSLVDADAAADFASGPLALASPGDVNPNQSPAGTVIARLVLAEPETAWDAANGILQLTATIAGVRTE